jgi:hypothetical protein
MPARVAATPASAAPVRDVAVDAAAGVVLLLIEETDMREPVELASTRGSTMHRC